MEGPYQSLPQAIHAKTFHDSIIPNSGLSSPATPTQPGHPDHPLYQQVRDGVAALDARYGRSFDATSERMTASLLCWPRTMVWIGWTTCC